MARYLRDYGVMGQSFQPASTATGNEMALAARRW
jgi:hypothetical protein